MKLTKEFLNGDYCLSFSPEEKDGNYIVYSLLIYKTYFPHKIILDSLAQIAHYSLAR